MNTAPTPWFSHNLTTRILESVVAFWVVRTSQQDALGLSLAGVQLCFVYG